MSQMVNVFSLLAFETAYLTFFLNRTPQFSLESPVWQIILETKQCFFLLLLLFPSHIVRIFPIFHNLEFFVQLKLMLFLFFIFKWRDMEAGLVFFHKHFK